MNTFKTGLAIAVLVFASAAGADSKSHGHKQHKYEARQDLFEYAKVVRVKPLYREVKVSRPVRECWEEPVYHTEHRRHRSAGGMLAGGLLGGIVGHQLGKGRNRDMVTAVGTIVGAAIGHDAVDSHAQHESTTVVGYEEHCKTRHQVSYEEVLDGYDVTYKYRGKRYHIEMPYNPGKRIKMRIQFTPVI